MASDSQTIKVRRHREADTVIRAGIPAPDPGDSGSKGGAHAEDVQIEPVEQQSSAAVSAAGSAASETPPPAAFHETTLDDIESSTMSSLQKGIIIGAVLLIIACIVWYVLFVN